MFDVRNIRQSIDSEVIKKIFGNIMNASEFLRQIGYSNQEIKQLKKNIYGEIVRIWNYEAHKDIIRNIFIETPKYKNGLEAELAIFILLEEWESLGMGSVEWPFSPGDFDGFVQRINSEAIERTEKDEKVKIASIKYRRIKEINTIRNDFIETLLFKKNEQIIPTLSHSRGVDFFIDGLSYDQKVSRSPTNQFKKDFGKNWKELAIEQPYLVAKYLYQYQDEGRFGASPRIFVVYLDENIQPLEIRNIIQQTDLLVPLKITFDYQHKSIGLKTYQTFCYVILLHHSSVSK
jgi:hypothetical protein